MVHFFREDNDIEVLWWNIEFAMMTAFNIPPSEIKKMTIPEILFLLKRYNLNMDEIKAEANKTLSRR